MWVNPNRLIVEHTITVSCNVLVEPFQKAAGKSLGRKWSLTEHQRNEVRRRYREKEANIPQLAMDFNEGTATI
jgi:hypothetical protein